jgi:hypothetical protein
MSSFRLFLWGWVVLALLATMAIGFQRIAWEGATRQVELALDLRDVQKLAFNANERLNEVLSALRSQGTSALVVDPAEVSDLRAAWPEWAQTASLDEPPLLDWPTFAQLQHDGWALIWKLTSPENSPSDFSAYLKRLAELTPQAYLPLDWGSESLVMPDATRALRATLDQPSSSPASLVLLEFHDYTPAAALYGQGFAQFVRAHTISAAELQEMSPSACLARFERAAIERSARLLYLHFPEESVGVATAEVSTLSERLQHDGFRLGALPSSSPPNVAWPTVTILFAGLAALLLLTLRSLWPFPSVVLASGWVVILGFELLGFAWNAVLARQAAALLAATLFPVSVFRTLDASEKRRMLTHPGGQAGFLWVAMMALGALLGGLLGASILSDLPFYEGLYLFRGVKLALILPIFLILALHAGHRANGPWWHFPWRRLLRWPQLLLVIGVGAILTVVLLRSGNDAFLPVSSLEDQTRRLLATLFYARPRFKEFLIGHPALFLWAIWGAPRFRFGSWPLLAIGLLGPVSIVNTYEHLHTPLVLSLARTAIGLALGLALGWALWRAVLWVERRWATAK